MTNVLRKLRSLGLISYMCVPMVAHDRTLGAMTIATAESGRHLADDDLRVAHDIATRAALAIETAQSYQQLQSANRLKDEFLATLSHELRTPLNAVLGYARMLQSGAIANEKIPQALEVIDRNAAALAQIVEDVLDVSRIVLGKARLKVEPTDVADVVEDAIATVKPAADAKGIHLNCSLGHGTATVSGRPQPAAAGRVESSSRTLSNSRPETAASTFASARTRLARRDCRQRYRHRVSAIVPAASVRAVPSGRKRHDPCAWRTGAGSRHRAAHRRDAWRNDRRRERRRREGRDLYRVAADEQVSAAKV